MKYYLIEIADGDEKIKGKAIYEFDTRDKAIANFHSKMGVAMKSDMYKSEQLIVINSANGVEVEEIYNNENWVEPLPESEEVTE